MHVGSSAIKGAAALPEHSPVPRASVSRSNILRRISSSLRPPHRCSEHGRAPDAPVPESNCADEVLLYTWSLAVCSAGRARARAARSCAGAGSLFVIKTEPAPPRSLSRVIHRPHPIIRLWEIPLFTEASAQRHRKCVCVDGRRRRVIIGTSTRPVPEPAPVSEPAPAQDSPVGAPVPRPAPVPDPMRRGRWRRAG